jgi:DNA-binding FadR family transcriptional regulator
MFPGDTLPNEADLSDAYDVSRTVMREALKGLAARGLVDSRTRVGTTVCPRSRWKLLDADVLSWIVQSDRRRRTLREAMELRLVVEPVAAQWAAERANAPAVARIEDGFHQLREAVGDRKAWTNADAVYHKSILIAGHNELVTNLVSTLHSVLPVRRQTTVARMDRSGEGRAAAPCEAATPRALALHRVLFEAIQAGDGEQARGSMQTILQRGRDVVRSRGDGEASSAGR